MCQGVSASSLKLYDKISSCRASSRQSPVTWGDRNICCVSMSSPQIQGHKRTASCTSNLSRDRRFKMDTTIMSEIPNHNNDDLPTIPLLTASDINMGRCSCQWQCNTRFLSIINPSTKQKVITHRPKRTIQLQKEILFHVHIHSSTASAFTSATAARQL
jgi:hypothetical protein